jgi:acyl carrier protein phosphodiesterase
MEFEMQQIKEYDVKLLRDILEYWHTLSEDTGALDCMTDHCHVEYWDGIELANRLEAIVSQAASQAMPEPNVSCENCKQYKPYDEGLGECKWFSNKTKIDYIFTAKDFFCKQFEQK